MKTTGGKTARAAPTRGKRRGGAPRGAPVGASPLGAGVGEGAAAASRGARTGGPGFRAPPPPSRALDFTSASRVALPRAPELELRDLPDHTPYQCYRGCLGAPL